MIIDDSRAHCIAKRIRRELADAAARNDSRTLTFLTKFRRVRAKKSNTRKLLAGMRDALRTNLGEFGVEQKSQQVGAWLLPEIEGENIIVISRTLLVDRHRSQLNDRRVMRLEPHALARLCQRTRNDKTKAALAKLREALRMVLPVLDATSALGLRQLAIPCGSGVLVGSLDDAGFAAKTYLHDDAPRWAAFRNAVISEFDAAPARIEETAAFGLHWPGYEEFINSLETRIQNLDKAWMHEPYDRRPDHVGWAFDAARQQCEDGFEPLETQMQIALAKVGLASEANAQRP